MKNKNTRTSRPNSIATQHTNRHIYLPIVASIMVATQAHGFGLQELQVNSYLGERLNANVALNLTANEQAYSNCFQVVNSTQQSDLPSINDVTARVVKTGNAYRLNLTSRRGITEPMAELTIATTCSSLPKIERTYFVMLNPSSQLSEASRQTLATSRTSGAVSNTLQVPTGTNVNINTVANRYTAPRYAVQRGSIPSDSNYTVTFGDSLTEIASRITGRPSGSLWRTAAGIHAANPGAFLNGDPNHIEVGANINIPSFANGFSLNEQQARETLMNPAYRGQTSFAYSSGSTADSIATNNNPASTNAIDNSFIPTITNSSPTNTTNNSFVAVNEVIPTLTLTTSLSALSLQRITQRAEGQVFTEFTNNNSFDLGTNPDNENEIVTEAVLSSKRTEDITTDSLSDAESAASNAETIPTIAAPTVSNQSSSKSFIGSILPWLIALIALSLATWKLGLPRLRKQLRLWNIRRHRAYIAKRNFRDRQKQRDAVINSTRISDKTETIETSNYVTKEKNETGLFEAPISESTYVEANIEQEEKLSTDFLNEDVLDVDFSLEDTATLAIKSDPVNKKNSIDVKVNKDKNKDSTLGPRKATVAKSVYSVEMIDDTGELVSLTAAFPELEAELNARIDSDESIEVTQATRLQKDEEYAKEIMAKSGTSNMEAEIDIDFDAVDIVGATQTVRIDTSDFDLDLPSLLDDSSPHNIDFEALFTEEEEPSIIGTTEADDKLKDTFSTEMISADDETRIAEVLIDEDGLTPEDFGVSSEELSTDRGDYGYLENDASIITEGLNIDFDELLDGDGNDNIIPFDPKKKKSA